MTAQQKLTFHSHNSPMKYSWLADGFPPPGISGTKAPSVWWLCLLIGPLFPSHLPEKRKTHLLIQSYIPEVTHITFAYIPLVRTQPDPKQSANTISAWVSPFLTTLLHIGEQNSMGSLSCLCCYVLPSTCAAWTPTYSLIQLISTNLIWPFKIHLKLCIIQRVLECFVFILI